MRSARGGTAARTAALVLAVLCAAALANTAFVVAYALRERTSGAGLAAAACTAVTAALGWGAVRAWRS